MRFLHAFLVLLALVQGSFEAAPWIWKAGSSSTRSGGSYNGVGYTGTPASRYAANYWTDSNGRHWVFDGSYEAYYACTTSSYTYQTNTDGLCHAIINFDLWEYKGSTGTWALRFGNPGYNESGSCSGTTYPGSRYWSSSWSDLSGQLWLLGGYGYDCRDTWGTLGDLWKFSPSTSKWSYVAGSSRYGYGGSYPGSIPGTGAPSGRTSGATWTDNQGYLWLFGGYALRHGDTAEMWYYNIGTNTWTIVADYSSATYPASFGSAGNPGPRHAATTWTDSNGDFWMFGGCTMNNYGQQRTAYNDLWKFTVSSKTWTWMGGTKSTNDPGSIPSVGGTGTPSARCATTSWIDSTDQLWVFGGSGGSSTSKNYYGDLWSYSTRGTKTWTFRDGSQAGSGVFPSGYGKSGFPFSRSYGHAWVDPGDKVYLFGGRPANDDDSYNDLWFYDGSTTLDNFIMSSSSSSSVKTTSIAATTSSSTSAVASQSVTTTKAASTSSSAVASTSSVSVAATTTARISSSSTVQAATTLAASSSSSTQSTTTIVASSTSSASVSASTASASTTSAASFSVAASTSSTASVGVTSSASATVAATSSTSTSNSATTSASTTNVVAASTASVGGSISYAAYTSSTANLATSTASTSSTASASSSTASAVTTSSSTIFAASTTTQLSASTLAQSSSASVSSQSTTSSASQLASSSSSTSSLSSVSASSSVSVSSTGSVASTTSAASTSIAASTTALEATSSTSSVDSSTSAALESSSSTSIVGITSSTSSEDVATSTASVDSTTSSLTASTYSATLAASYTSTVSASQAAASAASATTSSSSIAIATSSSTTTADSISLLLSSSSSSSINKAASSSTTGSSGLCIACNNSVITVVNPQLLSVTSLYNASIIVIGNLSLTNGRTLELVDSNVHVTGVCQFDNSTILKLGSSTGGNFPITSNASIVLSGTLVLTVPPSEQNELTIIVPVANSTGGVSGIFSSIVVQDNQQTGCHRNVEKESQPTSKSYTVILRLSPVVCTNGSKKSPPMWVWIVVGVGAAVVIGAIAAAVVVVTKKKQHQQAQILLKSSSQMKVR